jgi:hypothetical protein
MKSFFLFLSLISDDPSRPTTTKEIKSNLTLEQCVALALLSGDEIVRRSPGASGKFRCEPMVQRG